MTTNVTKARELASLVKPVRALLKKKRKLNAIEFVCQRIPYELKEAKDFVRYVQARPYAKAKNLAELWMNLSRESLEEAAVHEPEPITMQEETHVSSGDWYTSYLQTHSYADWVHLVEESIALRKAEDKLGSESRGSNANWGER